jgi:hypothetical protein
VVNREFNLRAERIDQCADELVPSIILTRFNRSHCVTVANTDGSVLQAGVETAQNLSFAIYGRVLNEDEG